MASKRSKAITGGVRVPTEVALSPMAPPLPSLQTLEQPEVPAPLLAHSPDLRCSVESQVRLSRAIVQQRRQWVSLLLTSASELSQEGQCLRREHSECDCSLMVLSRGLSSVADGALELQQPPALLPLLLTPPPPPPLQPRLHPQGRQELVQSTKSLSDPCQRTIR